MTDFENALFSSLPAKPKHTFSFERAERGGSGKIVLKSFQLKNLEKLHGESGPPGASPATRAADSFPCYVSLAVFNANLNQSPNQLSAMYMLGALQNVAMIKRIYPGWIPLIFLDKTSYDRYSKFHDDYIQKMLAANDTTIVLLVTWKTGIPKAAALSKRFGIPIKPLDDMAALIAAYKTKKKIKTTTKIQFNKTMWRFFPAACKVVNISRDADSRINMREAYAAKEWLMTDYPLHRIFDSVFFQNPILAGLWGSKPICRGMIQEEDRTCFAVTPPIPNLASVLEGFFLPVNLGKGYGIDELFMGLETKQAEKVFNTNLLTFGYGAFFSSTDSSFTLFKNFQSIKLGHKLYSLLPCKGVDPPAHPQSLFKKLPSGALLGDETSFVGENIEMDSGIPKGWVALITDLTMDYAAGKPLSKDWKALFSRHGIHKRPLTFQRNLSSMKIEAFKDQYGFDKRWFPHLWYAFDRIIQAETYTFTRIQTTNPGEYDIHVWEAAYRSGINAIPSARKFVLTELDNHAYEIYFAEPLLDVYYGDLPKLKGVGPEVPHFFKHVFDFIKKHSHVLKYLNEDQGLEYWSGALAYYPYSSMRMWNLGF